MTYQSGVALTLDPQLLQRAIITKEKLKEFEKDVPTFTNQPQKKLITGHKDDLRTKRIVIISFDTETSCGGKKAEIIQLAAQTTSFPGFSPTRPPERERERPWFGLVTCLESKKIP